MHQNKLTDEGNSLRGRPRRRARGFSFCRNVSADFCSKVLIDNFPTSAIIGFVNKNMGSGRIFASFLKG